MSDLVMRPDLFPLFAAVLAAMTCGILGNFLVLRKLSLMGDAISHSVLPGIVIAFLITTTRSPLAMFVGAAIAGVSTVVLVEVVKRLGRVEPGAAMGVVFSVLFALGVLLIESDVARSVDLDADCVLYGQLETLAWFPAPARLSDFFTLQGLSYIPRQIITLGAMAVIAFTFVGVFFKELRIAAFDPSLATSLGFDAGFLHFALMLLVAAATVASFEAVGSILVVAMLICPAATARLLTDRMGSQIAASVVFSLVSGVGGYVAAAAVPSIWGLDSVNAAGSMAVVAGVLVGVAAVLSPRYGVLTKFVRRRRLAASVACDDVVAAIFRASDSGRGGVSIDILRSVVPGDRGRRGVLAAKRAGFIAMKEDAISLTDRGVEQGALVVRRHRLWEHYLVEEAGVAADHVHDVAEQLEHISAQPRATVSTDPHGKPIP